MKRQHTYAQHFLRRPQLVHELVGHSDIKKRDLVLDLGAGSGVISSVLTKRAGQVWAVEYEPATLRKLRTNMARFSNVTVVRDDIMRFPLPTEPYKVFANIPFHLSSPLVARLTHAANPPQSLYLIVQRQFARKLLPDHAGFSSQLGMTLGPWWQARIRRPLQKTDFWPHPAVETVLLELKPRPTPLVPPSERDTYEQFIKRCFTDPAYFHQITKRQEKPSTLTVAEWIESYQDSKLPPSTLSHK